MFLNILSFIFLVSAADNEYFYSSIRNWSGESGPAIAPIDPENWGITPYLPAGHPALRAVPPPHLSIQRDTSFLEENPEHWPFLGNIITHASNLIHSENGWYGIGVLLLGGAGVLYLLRGSGPLKKPVSIIGHKVKPWQLGIGALGVILAGTYMSHESFALAAKKKDKKSSSKSKSTSSSSSSKPFTPAPLGSPNATIGPSASHSSGHSSSKQKAPRSSGKQKSGSGSGGELAPVALGSPDASVQQKFRTASKSHPFLTTHGFAKHPEAQPLEAGTTPSGANSRSGAKQTIPSINVGDSEISNSQGHLLAHGKAQSFTNPSPKTTAVKASGTMHTVGTINRVSGKGTSNIPIPRTKAPPAGTSEQGGASQHVQPFLITHPSDENAIISPTHSPNLTSSGSVHFPQTTPGFGQREQPTGPGLPTHIPTTVSSGLTPSQSMTERMNQLQHEGGLQVDRSNVPSINTGHTNIIAMHMGGQGGMNVATTSAPQAGSHGGMSSMPSAQQQKSPQTIPIRQSNSLHPAKLITMNNSQLLSLVKGYHNVGMSDDQIASVLHTTGHFDPNTIQNVISQLHGTTPNIRSGGGTIILAPDIANPTQRAQTERSLNPHVTPQQAQDIADEPQFTGPVSGDAESTGNIPTHGIGDATPGQAANPSHPGVSPVIHAIIGTKLPRHAPPSLVHPASLRRAGLPGYITVTDPITMRSTVHYDPITEQSIGKHLYDIGGGNLMNSDMHTRGDAISMRDPNAFTSMSGGFGTIKEEPPTYHLTPQTVEKLNQFMQSHGGPPGTGTDFLNPP